MSALYDQLAKSAINAGDFGASEEIKISRVFTEKDRIAIDGKLPEPITLTRGDYFHGLSKVFFDGIMAAEQLPMVRLWDEAKLGYSDTMVLLLKNDNGKVYERADITMVATEDDDPGSPFRYLRFVVICGSDGSNSSDGGRKATIVRARTPLALAYFVYESLHDPEVPLNMDCEKAWDAITILRHWNDGPIWTLDGKLSEYRTSAFESWRARNPLKQC